MREDMFKVIVERPRTGWRSAPRCRGRLSGEDDLPTKIGMKRHVAVTRIGSRWLNENLNPLKRYLGRQVGRPWDKVYSEISATLSPGHTVKAHVRQHLDDFVARDVSIDRSGTLIGGGRPGRYGAGPAPWRQNYYVDPEDGLLKDSAKLWKKLKLDPRPWKRRAPASDPDIRVLGPMRELRRIDGNWFEVRFEQDRNSQAWVFDLLSRTQVPATARHAVAKRQLARAELEKFAIENIYHE